jgi:hypothetical protein
MYSIVQTDSCNNIFWETDNQFDYSQLFESIDEFSDDEIEDLISAIKFPEDTIELQNETNQDAMLPIHALSALDQQLAELGITCTEFYTNLRSKHHRAEEETVRAHFDGGLMATTTDQLRYLWYYK